MALPDLAAGVRAPVLRQVMTDVPVSVAIEQAARLAAPVFAAMGWTWFSTSPHTPTIEDIKREYRHLHKRAQENESGLCESGRIGVRRWMSGQDFEFYVILGDTIREAR